jgi:GxxExxY protein
VGNCEAKEGFGFMSEIIHHELTESIIKCAFEVYNHLGSGFLEKVYENALLKEFELQRISAFSQVVIKVNYKGSVVGDYVADIVVEGKVLVELKAVERLIDIHELQLKNYLKATSIEVGLLLNFGKSLEIKRKYVKA